MQRSSSYQEPAAHHLGPRNVESSKVTKRSKRDPLPVSGGRDILSYMLHLYTDHKHFDQSFWSKALDKWIQVHRECQRTDYGGLDALKNWFFHNRLVHKKIVSALNAHEYGFEWIEERVVGTPERIKAYLHEHPQGRMAFPKSGKFQYKDLFDTLERETEKNKKTSKSPSHVPQGNGNAHSNQTNSNSNTTNSGATVSNNNNNSNTSNSSVNGNPGKADGSNNNSTNNNGANGGLGSQVRYQVSNQVVPVQHIPVQQIQQMKTGSEIISPNIPHTTNSNSLEPRPRVNSTSNNSNGQIGNSGPKQSDKSLGTVGNINAVNTGINGLNSVRIASMTNGDTDSEPQQPQINQQFRNILISEGFDEFDIGGNQGLASQHHSQQQPISASTPRPHVMSGSIPSRQRVQGHSGYVHTRGQQMHSQVHSQQQQPHSQRSQGRSNTRSSHGGSLVLSNSGGSNSNNNGANPNNNLVTTSADDSIDSLDVEGAHSSLQSHSYYNSHMQAGNNSSHTTAGSGGSSNANLVGINSFNPNSHQNQHPHSSAHHSQQSQHGQSSSEANFNSLVSIINGLENPEIEKAEFVGSLLEKNTRFIGQLLEEIDTRRQAEISKIVSWYHMYRQGKVMDGNGGNPAGGVGGHVPNERGGNGISAIVGLLGGGN